MHAKRNTKIIYVLLLFFLFLVYIPPAHSRTASKIAQRPHIDIFFHMLAFMDIGQDARSLYSPSYIRRINKAKEEMGIDPTGFMKSVESIKDLYKTGTKIENFGFFPFKFKSYGRMLEGLRQLAYSEEKEGKKRISDRNKQLLRQFIRLMDEEYHNFYKKYNRKTAAHNSQFKRTFKKLWRKDGFPVLKPFLKAKEKDALVYLVPSMTRNGKGFRAADKWGAAVKFPQNKRAVTESLFFAVHEISHQFINPITKTTNPEIDWSRKSTSRDDKSGHKKHAMIEKAVVYADYLLFKKYRPEYINFYIEYFTSGRFKQSADTETSLEENFVKEYIKKYLPTKTMKAIEDYIISCSNHYYIRNSEK